MIARDMAKRRGARKGNFSAGANVGLWALARRRVDEERDHGDESERGEEVTTILGP